LVRNSKKWLGPKIQPPKACTYLNQNYFKNKFSFKYFKKEEQNFVSLNEIDTMTLIMPSGPGRPRAAALDTAAAGGAAAGGGGGGKVSLDI